MPPISAIQLVNNILAAIQESGGSAVFSGNLRTHPRKFALAGPNLETSLWVYGWTLTPGGRPQLKNEYRIQMTSVSSPLELNPQGQTVLIGYEPNLKMFAGFDLKRHRTFTAGSPSVQIDITTLRQALQDGIAFDRKDNNEIAVGLRADQFLNYMINAEDLHKLGGRKSTYELLTKAASTVEVTPVELETLPLERRRIVSTVNRMYRSANFREQVLNAYSKRCAITRMQLRLVEAAHILPVGAPGSVDHVCNGLSLAPTYHRAYDNGLIYLDDDYCMRVNPEKEKELISYNLDGGLPDLRASLGKIHLPSDPRQWPNTRLIKKANEFRNIAI